MCHILLFITALIYPSFGTDVGQHQAREPAYLYFEAREESVLRIKYSWKRSSHAVPWLVSNDVYKNATSGTGFRKDEVGKKSESL